MDPRKEMEAKEVQSDDDAWVKEMMSKIKEQKVAPPVPTQDTLQTVESKPETTTTSPALADVLSQELPALPEISTNFDE